VVVVGLALILALYFGVTAVQVVRASGWNSNSSTGAIVVLGAAQYDGAPSPTLAGRLDHAYQLYAERVAPMVVLTGASKAGDRFTEAYAGLKYLRALGIPEGDLRVVTTGTSTYESLAAAKRVLDEEGIDDAILVSDPSHNLRIAGVANEIGLSATVSPTGAATSWSTLYRETIAVGIGRIFGYRRLDNFG
jgi:vancomycin permeability regulator SanA